MKKAFLDRDNFGIVYKFIPTPVWFTIEVEADPALIKALPLMTERFAKVNRYLDSLFEATRAGATPPPMPDDVKEIVDQCLAPVVVEPAEKPKPEDIVVDSNSELPSS